MPAEGKDAELLQRIAARIITLSVLWYVIAWAMRNYRTHRHQCVTNQHRSNALATFEAFVGAAKGDEGTKNAVLLEATRCVFAPATTGYLGAEVEAPATRVTSTSRRPASTATANWRTSSRCAGDIRSSNAPSSQPYRFVLTVPRQRVAPRRHATDRLLCAVNGASWLASVQEKPGQHRQGFGALPSAIEARHFWATVSNAY